jgi:hypothetical protein
MSRKQPARVITMPRPAASGNGPDPEPPANAAHRPQFSENQYSRRNFLTAFVICRSVRKAARRTGVPETVGMSYLADLAGERRAA